MTAYLLPTYPAMITCKIEHVACVRLYPDIKSLPPTLKYHPLRNRNSDETHPDPILPPKVAAVHQTNPPRSHIPSKKPQKGFK